METLTTALISAAVAIVTAVLGYKQGAKKSNAEANETIFESYNFAIESLRHEFEQRMTALQKENDKLRERVNQLEKQLENERAD